MCGIHGFVNAVTADNNADDFVKSGCVAGMLRGSDSTGVAVIDTFKETFDVHKLPLSGNHFVETKLFTRLLPRIRTPNVITIAHTRAATVGDIRADTAHPFEYYDESTGRTLVGVHNGTLTGWMSRKGAKDHDVDSQWALARIMESGKDAFKEFSGAYCFVWWDSETPTKLHMARNDERTMHIAFTEKKGMAYASEAGMVAWLAERHHIKLDGDIRALRSGLQYSFDLEDIQKVETSELPKATYTSQTTPTTYNSYTVVDKVEAFLRGVVQKESAAAAQVVTPIAAEDTTLTHSATTGERKPTVTKEEMDDARGLGMINEKGMFTPTHTDNRSDVLYGTVNIQTRNDGSWSCDAIMRNASNVEWRPNDQLQVTVLGAILTNTDLVAIVSKPRLTLVAQDSNINNANTAVAH